MIRFAKACGLAAAVYAGLLAAPAAQANQALIRSAQSWTIQLSGDFGRALRSSADVVVVDPDSGGRADRFKAKPGGGRRAAMAYLSVGEAETYRSYWKSCCAGKSPDWLTKKTQGWAGNYVVKFWDPAWKAIVRQQVREILAKGYDGLYLDRIDTWERSGSRAQMIAWVKEISDYARSIKGDVAIIGQNAEELLDNGTYLSAIDAIAKEDLFHGIKHDGGRNVGPAISASVKLLARARSQGKKIFVIEYLGGATGDSVAAEIRKQGFVPNIAGNGRNLVH
jgi:cysteinyl-tRNA synthetase, unknown class